MNLTTVPTDQECHAAWDMIMRIAERHALIVSAGGGVATLACPEEQRNAGVREKVLRAHQMQENSHSQKLLGG